MASLRVRFGDDHALFRQGVASLLTVSDGARGALEAARSEAEGCLSKKVEPQALYGTLRGVARGEAQERTGDVH